MITPCPAVGHHRGKAQPASPLSPWDSSRRGFIALCVPVAPALYGHGGLGGVVHSLGHVLQRGGHNLVGQPGNGALDVLRVQARFVVLLRLRARLNPLVRDHHWPHLALPVVQQAVQGHEVQHVVPKPANHVLLHRDQRVVVAGQLPDELRVQRLHEARVRHRHAHVRVLRLRALGRQHRGHQARAQAQHRHLGPRARARRLDHAALADGHRLAAARAGQLRQAIAKVLVERLQAVAGPAGEAHARGLVVDAVDRLHGVLQLQLVRGRHEHQVGQRAHVGQVEGAVVRGAVVAHQPPAVQHHAHGQVLQHHVVHHLIVAALHEGGVDRAEGLEALGGHARGHGHRVLLGDAHVEHLRRVRPPKDVHTRAAGHGGRDAYHLVVLLGDVHQLRGEDRGQRGRAPRRALLLLARGHVELGHAVHGVAGRQRGRVALALHRLDVQQDGLLDGRVVADVLQDGHQVVQVVPVDGAHVREAQLLKERAPRDDAAGVLVDPLVHLLQVAGQQLVDLLERAAEVLEGLRDQQPRGVRGQRGDGRRAARRGRARGQRHLPVVVEHHHQPLLQEAGAVHGLVGHAARDGPVADDGDAVVLPLVLQVLGHRVPQRRRDAGGGVARTKGVVLGLGHLAEAAQAVALPQPLEPLPAAREHLVRVALVGHVPDDLVLGRVEHVVQRHRQLHHAQRAGQVAPRLRDRLDHLPPQLIRKLLQFFDRKSF
mmetsp:Transcript_1304/g.2257  ORF Transcript_1304/g.2257 Transcript_1304/m.2257 type:complete len:713 (-) Transcript_1304:371-2509(-)